MNAELLQNLCTGLETLMRKRRQILASRVLAVEPKTSVAAFPLTRPAETLSPLRSGVSVERRHSLELRIAALCRDAATVQGLNARIVSGKSLPEGEGQGEGKASAQLKPLAA